MVFLWFSMAMLNNQSLNLPVSRFFSTCQVFTAKKAPEKPTEVSARLLPGAVAAVADGSTNTWIYLGESPSTKPAEAEFRLGD